MGEAGSKAKKWVYYIVFVLSVSAALIHLYYPMFGIWKTNRIIHLMLFLLIVLLTHPLKSENPKFNKLGRMLDGVLVLGVLAFSVHPLIDFDSFLLRAESLTRADVWMGTLGTLLTLEAVRRTLGLPMIILTVSSIAYALLGAHLPDLIAHKGAFWEDIINFVYVLPEGLYGLPIAVMTSYVFLFIIFGALLEASGGITHIMNFSNALVGKSIGGPAKISVISSGMMGSISGSAIANVVTTGTMTIPMMKRIGFSPHLAGGIEAIASTGGLIMPPIMGAAAFVMCEMVGIPYVKVIVMAAIPAVLYYFTLFIIVHLEAKRVNLDSNDLQKDRLSIYQSIRKGWWVAIPVLFLVASLVFQYSPSRSVVISILSLMVIIIVKSGIQEGIKLILQAFHSAARATGPISILCAQPAPSASCVPLPASLSACFS